MDTEIIGGVMMITLILLLIIRGIIMTREEARKAAEVMMAYAEGKEVEYFVGGFKDWEICNTPMFAWDRLDYRIKKEPTYRSFKNKEECWAEMQKHQPFGWLKGIESGEFRSAALISDDISYTEEFKKYTFADGTPFGIKDYRYESND